ncbi:MAG: DMT family transporter [Pseudomonadota bacterium]
MFTKTTTGAWVIVLGASAWGLFWIPLRHIDQMGIQGIWAIAIIMGFASLVAIPMALAHDGLWGLRALRVWRKEKAVKTMLIGICIGLTTVLYFVGVVITDVIRVVFLFYLLPVWAALLSRLIYGRKITPISALCIFAALGGLGLLLGADTGFPVPRDFGDWCGLAAGFFWGLGLSVIHDSDEISALATSASTFFFGAIMAGLAGLLLTTFGGSSLLVVPDTDAVITILPQAALFGIMILFPSMLGQIWGARHVEPHRAALLTMSEILLASASAYLLIGTDLTPIATIGGVIIVLSVLTDLWVKKR